MIIVRSLGALLTWRAQVYLYRYTIRGLVPLSLELYPEHVDNSFRSLFNHVPNLLSHGGHAGEASGLSAPSLRHHPAYHSPDSLPS